MVNFKLVGYVALGLIIIYFFGLFPASVIEKNILWKGLPMTVWSSTSFIGQGSSCSSWGGTVDPLQDTEGPITFESYSSFGQCSGTGASSGGRLVIKNPKQYSSIFLTLGGYSSTGYLGTSNCPSASSSIDLKQGSNSQVLASASASCVSSDKTLPAGILINIDEKFITIPSIQSVLSSETDDDLILSFSTDADAKNNGRSGKSSITLQVISFTSRPVAVIQPDQPASLSPVAGIIEGIKENSQLNQSSLGFWDLIKSFFVRLFSFIS